MALLNPLAAMRTDSSHSSSENTAVPDPVPATVNATGPVGRPRSPTNTSAKLDTAGSVVVKEKQDERTDGLEDRVVLADGRLLLTEEEAYPRLGFSFPTWKKWTILTVIFAIQCSMNLNSSLYANAVGQLSKEFHVSEQVRSYSFVIRILSMPASILTRALGCPCRSDGLPHRLRIR